MTKFIGSTLFFRTRTSLQCFALDSRCAKAKHCRDVLGRILGQKNKVQNPSLSVALFIITLLAI